LKKGELVKNKNSIFIFIVITIFLSLAKVFFIKDFKVTKEVLILSNKEIVVSDENIHQIESFLKPQNTQSPNWKNIVDFHLSIKKIINLENAQSYFEIATLNLPDLVICLRKNICGLNQINSFELDRTPAHLLIARSLNVIQETLKYRPDFSSRIDWNLITEISGLSGNEIKLASGELLSNFDYRNNGKEHLFDIVESYKGADKAKFYSQIAAELVVAERPVFVNTLAKSLAHDESETVLSIIDKMKDFHLTKIEVTSVSKALCRFKTEKDQIKTWNTIITKMSRIDDHFQQNCL
jgi:hypothetical protein